MSNLNIGVDAACDGKAKAQRIRNNLVRCVPFEKDPRDRTWCSRRSAGGPWIRAAYGGNHFCEVPQTLESERWVMDKDTNE